MPRFVALLHFAPGDTLRWPIDAESLSDARARLFEAIREEGDARYFEWRDDDLFLVPTAAVRYIRLIDAERDPGEVRYRRWTIEASS